MANYHVLNYFIPGAIYAYLSTTWTGYDLLQTDVLAGAALYYFIGVLISRFGSLVIQPIIEHTKLFAYEKSPHWTVATMKNPKINELSESANMFRTMLSMSMVLVIAILMDRLGISVDNWVLDPLLLASVLIITFAFALRKQNAYVSKRIDDTVSILQKERK